jgi:diguanylate cyclase (GGDEF)-like protein
MGAMTVPNLFEHRVQFYDSDAFMAKTAYDYIERARRSGNGVIVIATREHLESLQAMRQSGPGTPWRGGAEDCIFLDARETLAAFMVDGLPDPQRFDELVGALLHRVSRNGSRSVSAFGECAGLLCAEGNVEAALRLEQFWERIAQRHPLSLLCAYPMSAFADRGHSPAFQRICAVHSHVNPVESLHAVNDPDALYRAVALLQQRANALDSELRRRRNIEGIPASQSTQVATLDAARAELEKLAGQDALTGLPNRRVFDDRLLHAVERATRAGSSLALIFIDIDGFKAVNDNLGHAAGDHLLKQFAARLSLCARTADTVCRWGGDEFAVITEESDAEQACVLMQRIERALRVPFDLLGTEIRVSASLGLSLFPDDAADAQALMHNADVAMYHAKRAAKARESTAAAGAARVAVTQDRQEHASHQGS